MAKISAKKLTISRIQHWLISGFLIANFSALFAANESENSSKNLSANYQNISTASFESLSFFPKRSAPAKVEAINISKIPAEISAKISQITVKPGVVVKAGDTLAKLECTDFQARLISAQAIINQTKQQLTYETNELKRAIKVAHKSNLSKSEVERRQTIVNNLNFSIDINTANRDIAQKNVQRCLIKAPFNGLVSNRIANVGEMLAPGSPILELVQLNDSEVSATISLTDLASFNHAAEYSFVAQNHVYPLKLRSLFNFVANNSSSQRARFTFTEDSAIIGSTGRLEWKAPELHLPAYLLSTREKNDGVFIVRDGIAVFIEVENAEEGRPFIVNLSAKDKVVLDGRHALKPNQKLIVKQTEPDTKGAL